MDNGEVAFGGFTHQVLHSEHSTEFHCFGGERRFHEETVTLEHIDVRAIDALHFLMKARGYKAHFNGDKSPNLNNREFRVIFPIGGLIIPCDFSVEDTLFTNNIQKMLSKQALQGNTLKNPPWSRLSTFAVIDLQANHFYEALIEGESRIQRAVNWIQFRTDITVPCIVENGKISRIAYTLRKNFSRFNHIRYGLVIDRTAGAALFYLLDDRFGHPLIFKYDPDKFMKPITPIWS